jgi:hypothetical protein
MSNILGGFDHYLFTIQTRLTSTKSAEVDGVERPLQHLGIRRETPGDVNSSELLFGVDRRQYDAHQNAKGD